MTEDMGDSDLDAEGEEDVEFDTATPGVEEEGAPEAEGEDDDEDAEGEEVDAEGEEADNAEAEGETVGAVKLPNGRHEASEDEDEAGVASGDEDSASEAAVSSGSSDTGSDAEDDWKAESDAADDDVEVEHANPNRCIFCGEDEEHDPSEDFEEYLACAVCGDNAHRQCARTAKSISASGDSEHWRCPACVENGLVEDDGKDLATTRRRSSAPKITRDLLPAKPESDSVFNTLILDDDPMDGSRALRKRKSASEDEIQFEPSRKRKRASRADSDDEASEQGRDRSTSVIRVLPRRSHANAIQSDSDEEVSNEPRSGRRRTTRKVEKPTVGVWHDSGGGLIVSFKLDPNKLSKILARKPNRKKSSQRKQKIVQQPVVEEVSHYPGLQPMSFSFPMFGFGEREEDSLKAKPYGGILAEEEADISKTFPQPLDRKRFEDARQKAEDEWRERMAAAAAAADAAQPVRPAQKAAGGPSKIKCINFGGYEIDTWHAAPYPEEYSRNRVLYICEFCLKYMNSDYVAWRHKLKCPAKHPPGDEIYRDGSFSFWEVDGRKNPVYCQNLCLLAKLFLGSKTLYYDVEPFLFYVMTENDEFGCHFVGYFSKEKRPSSLNNVSCILVLPIHQRRGFGHLLIDFSYLLTKVEKKTGSPEKPLSDMGLVSYRSYWRLILSYELLKQQEPVSITQLSERTGMTADDIVSALEGLRALVRDPVTKTYALRLDRPFMREYIENYEKKGYVKLNPNALIWTPYVMGRHPTHYEEGPHLATVAPREEEEEKELAHEEMQRIGLNIETSVETDGGAGKGKAVEVEVATPGELLTPTEEGELVVLPVAKGPTSASSARGSPMKTTPSTPMPNGDAESVDSSESHIPPSRFEIFPPVPGAVARRKVGRPFGRSGRRSTGSYAITPVRRTTSRTSGRARQTPATGTRTVAARRTRSKLGEMVNGIDEDEGDLEKEHEEEDDVEGGPELAASQTPMPHDDEGEDGGEGDQEEEEDEENEDDDAEGEDEDAEGEPDDLPADGVSVIIPARPSSRDIEMEDA